VDACQHPIMPGVVHSSGPVPFQAGNRSRRAAPKI
jgi:hypothetical protein